MTDEPTMILMPRELSRDMLRAVREHPLTESADRDKAMRDMGWLVCAWDVLLEFQLMKGAGHDR